MTYDYGQETPENVKKAFNKLPPYFKTIGVVIVLLVTVIKYFTGISFVVVALSVIFLAYVIFMSKKIDTSLKNEYGSNVVDEYNRHGDALVFNKAVENGPMKIFDLATYAPLFIFVPFGAFLLMLGVLSLQSGIIQHNANKIIPGIMALILGIFLPMFTLFTNKRILTEAIRRNEFVQVAQRRWKMSKIIIVIVLIVPVVSALWLISSGKNFMENREFTKSTFH